MTLYAYPPHPPGTPGSEQFSAIHPFVGWLQTLAHPWSSTAVDVPASGLINADREPAGGVFGKEPPLQDPTLHDAPKQIHPAASFHAKPFRSRVVASRFTPYVPHDPLHAPGFRSFMDVHPIGSAQIHPMTFSSDDACAGYFLTLYCTEASIMPTPTKSTNTENKWCQRQSHDGRLNRRRLIVDNFLRRDVGGRRFIAHSIAQSYLRFFFPDP